MSNNSTVVPFPQNQRPVGADTAAGRALADCREFAIRRLRSTVRNWLPEVEQELEVQANSALDRDSRLSCLEARTKAQAGWTSVEAGFVSYLSECFEKRQRGEELGNSFDPVRTATSLSELKLVEEDELTEEIAVQDMATAIQERCEEDLYALNERFANLFGKAEGEGEDSDNPFNPELICVALRRACDGLDSVAQVRLLVLDLLQRKLGDECQGLYADLNQRMLTHNVLPQLRRTYRKAVNPSPQRGGSSANEVDANMDAMMRSQPFSSTMSQPFGGMVGGMGDMPNWQGAGQEGAQFANASLGGVGVPGDVYQLLQQLVAGTAMLGSLTQQTGGVASPNMPGEMPANVIPINAESWASLNKLQQLPVMPVQSGVFNARVLHDLQGSAMVKQFSQVDSLTVDIVAMLFDFVFDDAQIPDPIKALIGRLQIPVLKVAMLDKSFFSTKAHPARRLLDALSRAAVSLPPDVTHEDPVYCRVADLVARIQDEFDQDMSVFDQVLHEFENWLDSSEYEETQTLTRSVKMMEARERAEATSRQAVKIRMADSTPPLVRHFLEVVWTQVMVEIAMSRDGEGSVVWRASLQTASDLAWSTLPKTSTEERTRLISLLPTLLKRINEGVSRVTVDEQQMTLFREGLMRIHSAAIRHQPIPQEEMPKAQLPQAARSQVQAVDGEAANESTSVGSHEFEGGQATPSFLHRQFEQEDQVVETIVLSDPVALFEPEQVSELKRGDWVEFRHEGGQSVRGRLAWTSPQRGILLFTNPQSPRAIAIAPSALEAQMRNGLARKLDNEPMFDRAVDRALENLKVA